MNKSILSMTLFVLFSFINLPSSTAQHLSIANQSMNVGYIGVSNPLSIAVSNYAAEQIQVSVDNGTITGENGKYIWQPLTPGRAAITVSIIEKNGTSKVVETTSFRVKRIPDPVAKLGSRNSGTLSLSEFKAQGGIIATISNFDMAGGNCSVLGYNMTVVPLKPSDVTDAISRKAKFEGTILNLVNRIKVGDTVYFDNIKCRCPGDKNSRKINSLVFKIK